MCVRLRGAPKLGYSSTHPTRERDAFGPAIALVTAAALLRRRRLKHARFTCRRLSKRQIMPSPNPIMYIYYYARALVLCSSSGLKLIIAEKGEASAPRLKSDK